MKYYETKFEEYVTSCEKKDLHPETTSIFNTIHSNFDFQNNMILYGPPGVGKYTQSLKFIKPYSPSGLKYERKMNVNHQKKRQHTFKISDIHFEIDMELLGCHARVLWNEIYKAILDILSARQSHKGIIVCKNFHKIHNELLDIFYSYMQSLEHKNIKIAFILITETVSFLPKSILNRCITIPIKRPTKSQYKKCIGSTLFNTVDTKNISNIKSIVSKNNELRYPNRIIVDRLINDLENYKELGYLAFRDRIYDIFIYHLDLYECLWQILAHFIKEKNIDGEHLENIQFFLSNFLKFYNNNYRPIYHLERLMFYLCSVVHEL